MRSNPPEGRSAVYLLLWLAAVVLGTFVSGKPWPHYYLNWLPSMTLLAGLLIAGVLHRDDVEQADNPSRRAELFKRGLAITLILGPLLLPIALPAMRSSARLAFNHFVRGAAYPQDGPAQMADYLNQRVSPDDSIFVTDYEPILYYLVHARAATRYTFPPVLTVIIYQQTGHIKALAELDRMMTQPPKYVIQTAGILKHKSPHTDNWAFVAALGNYLADRYTLEKTFEVPDTFTGQPVAVELYRLKP